MNTEHINNLLVTPANIAASDLPDLRQLVQEYPWCQSFQVLYAKALKLSDDPGFNHQLKKTAVYASDRKILYRLIMQPGLQKSIADFEQLTKSELPSELAEAEPTPENVLPVADESAIRDVDEKPESTGEEDVLDDQNLEQEVLKEVAARAYQIDFESKSDLDEQPTTEALEEIRDTTESGFAEKKRSQPISFIDFITGGQSHSVLESPEESEAEESLIERFIQNEPKIERKKTSFFSPINMGKMSLVDNDEMVSETLAGIYARQGDLDKARRAYEQLALKYPEKSSYFAGLIKKMEASKSKK